MTADHPGRSRLLLRQKDPCSRNARRINVYFYLISALAFTRPSGCWLTAHIYTHFRFNALAKTPKRLQFILERTSAAWILSTANHMMRGEQRIATSDSPLYSAASCPKHLQLSPASAAILSQHRGPGCLSDSKPRGHGLEEVFEAQSGPPQGFLLHVSMMTLGYFLAFQSAQESRRGVLMHATSVS